MKDGALQLYGTVAGRILLGAIFVLYGLDKIFGFMGMGYSGLTGAVSAKGLPMPHAFAILAILLEAGGGLMLVLGFRARLAAWMLIVFVAAATILFHPIWSDPSQMTSFWKNVSILGGLLYVTAYGSGQYSLSE